MRRGAKYLTGLTKSGPKTGRRYGHMVAAVRSRSGVISTADFLPVYNRTQIALVLRQLTRNGEYELVKRGRNGRDGGTPAQFQRR